MLQKVMQRELERRGLNYREAAEEIGVTHTTIYRILQGENVNRDTLVKISDWTGVSIATLLGMTENQGSQAIASLITGLIEKEPGLRSVFEEAYQSLLDGEIAVDDIRDIAVYAAYKLSLTKR